MSKTKEEAKFYLFCIFLFDMSFHLLYIFYIDRRVHPFQTRICCSCDVPNIIIVRTVFYTVVTLFMRIFCVLYIDFASRIDRLQ